MKTKRPPQSVGEGLFGGAHPADALAVTFQDDQSLIQGGYKKGRRVGEGILKGAADMPAIALSSGFSRRVSEGRAQESSRKKKERSDGR